MAKNNNDPRKHKSRRKGPSSVTVPGRLQKYLGLKIDFDEDSKKVFLAEFARTGRKYQAAEAAGVCAQAITRAIRTDPDFAEAYELAQGQFQDQIEAEIKRRAIEGWDEPVFDYKGGGRIGVVRKFSDRLLVLMAGRHIPEYREKQSSDVNLTGGVLVINSPGDQSADEWRKEYNKKK